MRDKLNNLHLSLRKRWHELRREKYFIRRIRGQYFLLDKDNNVDRRIDAFGAYEAGQHQYLLGLCDLLKPDRFLDIGAHWGLYSLAVALRPGLERTAVTAFEPDPINRAQLYGNLFLNRLEKVEVLPYGASDADATVSFERKGEHNRGASRISTDGKGKVEVRRVDGLLTASNECIAMKLDVEGHEAQALAGLQALTHNNRCLLQVESHSPENIPALLTALGPGYRHLRTILNDHYFSNIPDLPDIKVH